MNTSKNIETGSERTDATDLPPVLARVPWLGGDRSEEVAGLARATQTATFDATLIQPHQLVAAADVEVTDFAASRTHWRFDPPQNIADGSDPHHRLAARPIAPATTETPAVAAPQPAVRPVTTPGSDGITHLRFDPPATSAPPVASSPSPAAKLEASQWHKTVALVDNTLRQYHRVIMLATLLTAAGLMMLVLENQQPDIETEPETPIPAAADFSDSQPLPLAKSHGEPPAIPEQIAMAQGPQTGLKPPAAEVTEADESPTAQVAPIATFREARDADALTPIDCTPPKQDATGYPSTNAPAIELAFPPMPRLSPQLQLSTPRN